MANPCPFSSTPEAHTTSYNLAWPNTSTFLIHLPPSFPSWLEMAHIFNALDFVPKSLLTSKTPFFFHIPFYLFPIQGADVVLGMEWLETLGPISADFSIPSLSFLHENSTVILQGNTTSQPAPSTFHHIFHLHHDSVASMLLLTYNPTTQTDTKPQPQLQISETPPPNIHAIIQKYSSIFQAPHGLPPLDHMIITFPSNLTPPPLM